MSCSPLGAWLALLCSLPPCVGAGSGADAGANAGADADADADVATMQTGSSQDDVTPMNMTAEEMTRMPQQPAAAPDLASHAPDTSLERPANSEHVTSRVVAGMDMDDASLQHLVWVENLEAAHGSHNGGAWDAQGWYGGDFDKLWVKTEGERFGGRTEGAKVEALWAHAILPYWDTQLGVRHDVGGGPAREWAAFGLQGVSPYWFDIEITGYVGEEGRTAARLKTEYDLYLTERWVLKPEIELNAYGKPDQDRALAAGLAHGQFELRLRYEITRRFAPYAGFVYDRKFAGTALLARTAGEAALDHRAVAGIDFFF